MRTLVRWLQSQRTLAELLVAVGSLAFVLSVVSAEDDDIQPDFVLSAWCSKSAVLTSAPRRCSSSARRRPFTEQIVRLVAGTHVQGHSFVTHRLPFTILVTNPAGNRAPPRMSSTGWKCLSAEV